MKDLLVATVFGNNELDPYNGRRNEQWKELMKRFLKKTTPQSYDIVAWCNSCEIDDDEIEVIGHSENEWKEIEIDGKIEKFSSHTFVLQKILNYFRQSDYENFLILDSDCFPIKYNWLAQLLFKIKENGEVRLNRYAAIIRTENLDIFPHPSAFFIPRRELNLPILDFKPNYVLNMLNEEVVDTGTKIPLSSVFPLIRTNVWNPHPIFAGIYYDMFYHHCCGSTLKKTRATEDFKYYDFNPIDHVAIEKWLFDELTRDPEHFISKLRGVDDLV